MFGFIQANTADLSDEENCRYRAAYCGLCRSLGQRHGLRARLSLTYDLTFLLLLLSSLYEPEERHSESRCAVHPGRKHPFMTNECTDYAADMTVALTYHKCLDDWQDEKKLSRKCYAAALTRSYEQVKLAWPVQCAAIEENLRQLSALESSGSCDPDAAARCFGRLMEELFLYRRDPWEPNLRLLGQGLGQYIYLADAAIDLKQDRQHGRYNPLAALSLPEEELSTILSMVLGDAARGFEQLPLVQDVHLLRNILYSGLWIKFNRSMQKAKKASE